MGLSRRLFIGASLSAATASVMAGANVAELLPTETSKSGTKRSMLSSSDLAALA